MNTVFSIAQDVRRAADMLERQSATLHKLRHQRDDYRRRATKAEQALAALRKSVAAATEAEAPGCEAVSANDHQCIRDAGHFGRHSFEPGWMHDQIPAEPTYDSEGNML